MQLRSCDEREQRPDRAGEEHEQRCPQQDHAHRTGRDIAPASPDRLTDVLARDHLRGPGTPPPGDNGKTARKVAALIRNTVPPLVAASTIPPIAGPIARARFWFTTPSEIACARSPGGTSSGYSVCQVGAVRAWPVQTAKMSASSSQGVTKVREHQRAEGRGGEEHESLRDEQEPATVDQVADRAGGHREADHWQAGCGPDQRHVAAELVRLSISHCAPTVCIQLPMLVMNCASHIAANERCRNGAHAYPRLAERPPSSSLALMVTFSRSATGPQGVAPLTATVFGPILFDASCVLRRLRNSEALS
jgi:hypothetical protein